MRIAQVPMRELEILPTWQTYRGCASTHLCTWQDSSAACALSEIGLSISPVRDIRCPRILLRCMSWQSDIAYRSALADFGGVFHTEMLICPSRKPPKRRQTSPTVHQHSS